MEGRISSAEFLYLTRRCLVRVIGVMRLAMYGRLQFCTVKEVLVPLFMLCFVEMVLGRIIKTKIFP